MTAQATFHQTNRGKSTRWRILLVAFGIPLFLLGFIYILNQIYPFGDEMYLRMDMYHQYAPFLKQFQTILKEGGSLEYSWNIGLGSDFFTTYAYYLASPFNWLIGLLPSHLIPEIMNAFILLKAGLMSLSFTWYLLKKFHKSSFIAAFFGILYALSGYFVAYSWNVMWLDCLVLLPLLLYGMERLVKEKRFELYIFSLALMILSNYYIGLIVGIWTIIYFVYLLAAETKEHTASSIFRSLARYVVASLFALCLAAVIWIPVFAALSSTASGGVSFPQILNIYFNPLEMFAHASYGSTITLLEGYLPNIYCGMIMFLLFPLYFINRKIRRKEKVGKAVLVLLFWFSFSCNFPAFIWHGLHFPNSLPARQAFIYIAVILAMGYETIMKLSGLKKMHIVAVSAASGVSLLLLQVLFPDTLSLSYTYVSILFLLCYLLILCLMRTHISILRQGMVVVLAVICMCEVLINAYETGFGTANRPYYVNDNQAIEQLLQETRSEDFARVEKSVRKTKNDGAWSNYPSASLFSSAASKRVTDFYDACGMESSMNSFGFSGHTFFTSALLRVKYMLTKDALDNNWYTYQDAADEELLYQAAYTLPLGFMVDDFPYEKDMEETSFDFQNRMLEEMKQIEPIFTIDHPYVGTSVVYYPKQKGRLYLELLTAVKKLKFTQTKDGIISTKTIEDVNHATVVDIGDVDESMTLTFFTEEGDELTVIPAIMDEETFQSAMKVLSEEPLKVTSYDDTHLDGEITADKERLLFLSVPNDKGWTLYVDGKKQEITIKEAPFLNVALKKGTHQIHMEYHTPGLLLGGIISAISWCVFLVWLLLCFLHWRKQRRNGKLIRHV